MLLLCQHPEPLAVISATSPFPWSPDAYLIPTVPEDPLLQVDFEPQGEGEGEETSALESANMASEGGSEVSLEAR